MASAGGISVMVDDRVTPRLVELARRLKDIDPALDEIGASQTTEVQERFERQVGPDGTPWRPLAARTLAQRTAKSPKILRLTGNLYDSYLHKVSSQKGVMIGSNRRYARIHNLGGKAGRGRRVTIPARPQLGISEAGAKEIIAIIADHLGGER